jgi:hypothetical protein
MKRRQVTLKLTVEVDSNTVESAVEDSINEALQEYQRSDQNHEWVGWVVGRATVETIVEEDSRPWSDLSPKEQDRRIRKELE